ncbi:PQQ-binding-like beta-propeller repeat protein [Halovivax limisalsi]|uniref:outer membrane protein assembly factor BamB family protein n=1 Tax=Halovivax limisalsi TaxID=1453760 RepID=UPI001FFDC453|nr:PQQ-binding-like beta-propeller repeat protein [Halovivax limisalsi]
MSERGDTTVLEGLILCSVVCLLVGSFGLAVAAAGSSNHGAGLGDSSTADAGSYDSVQTADDRTVQRTAGVEAGPVSVAPPLASAPAVPNETPTKPPVMRVGKAAANAIDGRSVDIPAGGGFVTVPAGDGASDRLTSVFYQPAPPSADSPLLFSDTMPIEGVEIYGDGGTGISGQDGVWESQPVADGEYIQYMSFEGYPYFDSPGYLRVYRYDVPKAPAWVHTWMPCGRFYQGPNGLFPPPPEPPEEDHGEDDPNVPVWEPGISITPENPEVGEPVTISGCDPFVALEDHELEWDLDDGTVLAGEEIVHAFDEAGVYEVGPLKGEVHRENVTVGGLEITRALPDAWFTDEVDEYYQVKTLHDDRTLDGVTVDGVEAESIGENDFRVAIDPFGTGDGDANVDIVAKYEDGETFETTTDGAISREPDWIEGFDELYDAEPGSGEWCPLEGDWPDGETCELRHADAFDWHPHEDGFVFTWAGIPGVPGIEEGLEVRLTDRTIVETTVPDGGVRGQRDRGATITVAGRGIDASGSESLDFDGIDFLGGSRNESAAVSWSPPFLSTGERFKAAGIGGLEVKVTGSLGLSAVEVLDDDFGLVERTEAATGNASGLAELSALGASVDAGAFLDIGVETSQEQPVFVETIAHDGAVGVEGSITFWGLWEGEFECGAEWADTWDVGPDAAAPALDGSGSTGWRAPTSTDDPFYCEGDHSWDSATATGGSGLALRDARGSTVLPGVGSIDTESSTSDGDASASTTDTALSTAASEEVIRLTDRPFADTEPSITETHDGHAVAWSRLSDDAETADGHDVVVRVYDEASGWAEPVAITADDRHDIEPTIRSAPDSDELLAVWTRLDEPVDAFVDPDAAAAEFEIVASQYDGDAWSQPEPLTENGALDRAPVLEATADGWVVAWQHHPNSDRLDLENALIEYRVLDSNGSVESAGAIENASLPALGADSNGTVELASYAAEDGLNAGAITYGTIDDDGFDSEGAHEYAIEEYAAHDVGGGELLWARGGNESYVLERANASGVDRLSTDVRMASIADLSVTGDGADAVATYRGTPEGQTSTDVFYRRASEGGWSGERRVTTGFDENASILHADSISTGDGLASVYTLREPNANGRTDLFQSTVAFTPALDLDVDGPSNASAGEAVTVEATVRNAGAVESEATSLVITDGETVLVTEPVDPLAANESRDLQLAVTVPDEGRVAVSVGGNESTASEWYARNASLRLGTPDLAVASVDGLVSPESGTVTNGTVSVVVENRGGVDAAGVPVRVSDGDEWSVDERIDAVPAGERVTVDVAITTDSFDTSAVDRVRIDPEETLGPAASQPRRADVATRFFAPELDVHEPIRYEAIEHYNGSTAATASVLASNRGPIDADATIEVRDLETGEDLGSAAITLPAPASGTITSDRLTVDLADVSEGQRLEFVVRDDATGRPAAVAVEEVTAVETTAIASLSVTVRNEHTGEAVENATVEVLTHSPDPTHRSDSNGTVALDVPGGPHVLWLSKPGYEPVERSVRFASAGSATLNASLAPTVAVTDAVAPERVELGETVPVTATVENEGATPTRTRLELRADGADDGGRTIDLAPNETREVTIDVAAPENRSAVLYEVAAGGSSARAVTAVGVGANGVDGRYDGGASTDGSVGSDDLAIESVAIPEGLGVGEARTIQVTASNAGADPAVGVPVVRVTGESVVDRPVGAAVVDVDPGENATVPIAVDLPSAGGEYEIRVDLGTESVAVNRPLTGAGERRWRAATDDAIWSSPTIYAGTVYVGSNDGGLYAIDEATGERRWRTEVGGSVSASPAAAPASGHVYAGGADGLYALDAETGEVEWVHGTEWPVLSSPTVEDGTVYAASQGVLYALDAATGDVVWSAYPDGGTESSPVVVDGTVYVGSYGTNEGEGYLHAFDAADGTERWRSNLGAPVTASPTVVGGTAFVGSYDGHLYALDATSGERAWLFDTGGAVYSSPTVADGTVYVGTGYEDGDQGAVFALDAATGSQAWSTGFGKQDELFVSSPTVADGIVYVGTQRPAVYAFDAASGTERWRAPTNASTFSSPTVHDGTLYVGSMDGSLYAMNVAGNRSSEGSRVEQESLGHVVTDEPDPAFDVEIAETNAPVEAGETLSVGVDVANVGAAAGTDRVGLSVGGVQRDDAELGLSPGESRRIELAWETDEGDDGDHTATVASSSAVDTRPVTVTPPPAGEFELVAVEAETPVTAGEAVSVAAEVANVGTDDATRNVTLDVAGERVDSVERTLAPNETGTVALTWETEPGDVGTHALSVATDGSSAAVNVTVEAPGDGPDVRLTNVTTNEPVTEGEYLDVVAELENVGDAAATQSVTLEIDGDEVDAVTVDLVPNESTTETLRWPTDSGDAGTYQARVSTANHSATRTVTVSPSSSAHFRVTDVTTNAPVAAGESLAVTATVENVGGDVGTQPIELSKFDGTVVDATNITLAVSGWATVELRWETDATDVGTGTVTVASDDDANSATVEIVDPDVCDRPGDVDGDGAVTSLDATLTQRHIAGFEPDPFEGACADLTDDGTVTPADVTAIHQLIVGTDRS